MFDNVWVYMSSWLFAFFFAGVIFYIWDRSINARISRWIYNLTHPTPLAEGKEKGLIYQQPTSRKFLWAFIVSTVQSVLVFWAIALTIFNPLVEFILWLIEIPVMVIGMFVGAGIYKWWVRRKEFYRYIDDVEAGKAVLDMDIIDRKVDEAKDDMKKRASGFTEWLKSLWPAFMNMIWPKPVKRAIVQKHNTESAPKSDVPKEDPRDLIRRFSEGSKPVGGGK